MSKKHQKSKPKSTYSSKINLPSESYENAEFTPPTSDKVKNNRPLFSFRHICQKDFCAKKMPVEKFKAYSDKLRILSDLEWSAIESSPKETNGFELMPVSSLNATLPTLFKTLQEIWVFRFGGGGNVGSRTSGRIAGVREGDSFFVLFIDRDFTLYNHGS